MKEGQKAKWMLIGAFFLAGIILSLAIFACDDSGGVLRKYTVTKGDHTNGDFTIDPASAAQGATITLTPTAKKGFEFNSWTFNPDTVTAEETEPGSGIYTFKMPASNVTVEALFVPAGTSEFNIIKGTHIGGDFIIWPESATAGAEITLTPTADAGYEFGSFNFNPDAYQNGTKINAVETEPDTYTFEMPGADVTVNAVFIALDADRYPITKETPTGGDFTISPQEAAQGATILLTPTADEGYVFHEWILTPSSLFAFPNSSGGYTFTMPSRAVTVKAVFVTASTSKFNISKGTENPNGPFTISAESALANETITLTPGTPVDPKMGIVAWTFFPGTVYATLQENGTYTFTMPPSHVTVTPVVERKYGNVSGTKTLTVVSGLGKLPSGNAGNSTGDTKVYAGTRHITVSVTLANGRLTNVVIGHPVEGALNTGTNLNTIANPFKTWSNELAVAIKTAKDPEANYIYSGLITDPAGVEAWDKHEAAIRDAVTQALVDLQANKPNRTLAGGGDNPWTANGAPITGTATITGAGHMLGSSVTADYGLDLLPTDITLALTVAQGNITTVVITGDDTTCGWAVNANGTLGNLLKTALPKGMVDNNNYNTTGALDALSGATNTTRAVRGLADMAMKKLANEY